MCKLVILLFLMSCLNILGLRSDFQGNDTLDLTKISNDVSVDFYQIIAKGNGNVLSCPLSLNILLAMTTISAGGNTAEELRSALHLDIDNIDIEHGYKKLLDMLRDESLKIATRMFAKKGVSIVPEFLTSARMFFNSDVQEVDYTEPEKAAKIVNTFVEENTDHKIHDLVDANSLSAETLLLLVNAVHFKEDWKRKFKHSTNSTFYLSKDKQAQTVMMHSTEYYKYKELADLDAKVLQVPYKSEGYSMLIILPNEIDGIHKAEKGLKFVNFKEIIHNRYKTLVSLKMPKFKIENTLELKAVCEQLGIKSMFLPGADLSGLVQDPLYVTDIIQKTFIQVDEQGVTAASAVGLFTSLLSSREPRVITFTADHPFIFVLMKGEMVLFLGRFCQI